MTENNSGRKQDIYSVYKLNQRDLRSPALSGTKDAETSLQSLYFIPLFPTTSRQWRSPPGLEVTHSKD